MDAVIAWVDGSDPDHLAKRQAAMRRLGLAGDRAAVAATRFSDLGEVYFCVASILKHAPFIRRIHIVTDAQSPAHIGAFADAGLCAKDRIRIVDHRHLFRDHLSALPCFNSQSIEALIWAIEGLDDEFLYFNDDFFLNGPLRRDDLVTHDGRLRLEGQLRPVWPTLTRHRLRQALLGRGRARSSSSVAQARAAVLAGCRRYVPLLHIPRPVRTSTLRDFFAAHPDVLRDQLRHAFRADGQFVPNTLANMIELAAGTAVLQPARPLIYLKPGDTEAGFQRQLALIGQDGWRYGCVQSLDDFAPERRAALIGRLSQVLASHLPSPVITALTGPVAPE